MHIVYIYHCLSTIMSCKKSLEYVHEENCDIISPLYCASNNCQPLLPPVTRGFLSFYITKLDTLLNNRKCVIKTFTSITIKYYFNHVNFDIFRLFVSHLCTHVPDGYVLLFKNAWFTIKGWTLWVSQAIWIRF